MRADQGAGRTARRLGAIVMAWGGAVLPLAAAAQAFRDSVPARLAAVRSAVLDGGGPALVQAAHALKGSAANIGAGSVAALCSELEGLGPSSSAEAR